MPGRHGTAPRRRGSRWYALAATTLAGTATLALTLGLAGSASATATPTPTYHAGSDTATFTATGVEDGNCLISTGGTDVYIEPGDKLTFQSALVGINLGSLNTLLSQVTGANVTAVIDGDNKLQPKQTVSVTAGKTTDFPGTGQTALVPGNHPITWTMNSVALLPGLLGSLTNIPLTSANLDSGASLSWSGDIHVTTSAPQCTIAVATPGTTIKVGPVSVSVPPVAVTVPVPVPVAPSATAGRTTSTPSTGSSTSGSTVAGYTVPGLSVPQQVMPAAGSGGGGFAGAYADNGSSGGGAIADGTGNGTVPSGAAPSDRTSPAAETSQHTVDAATSTPASSPVPTLLAVAAIIALSLVTATYARMYLLRKRV